MKRLGICLSKRIIYSIIFIIPFCAYSNSSYAQGVGCNNVFNLFDSNTGDGLSESQGTFTLEANPISFNFCEGPDVLFPFTRIFKLPSGGPYEGFVFSANSSIVMKLVTDCCREVGVCGDISSQFQGGEIETLDLPVICSDQEHVYVIIAGDFQETFTLSYQEDALFGSCDPFESCAPCPTQDCEDLEATISCASNFYSGNIDNSDTNDFNTECVYSPTECYEGGSFFNGADELFAIEVGSTPKDIRIALTGLQGDLDIFLFRDCSNGEVSGLSGCVANSLNSNNSDEVINVSNASGTYYLVVDGFEAGIVSPYNLTLTCPGPICDSPIMIACGQDVDGDTGDEFFQNINSDYSLCGAGSGFTGPDIVYQITDFELADSTDIFIGLRELGVETQAGLDIFVIENCGQFDESGNSLATCVDYIERTDTSGVALLVIPNANPNSEYYVIVDSRGAVGDFKLSVSCPEICTNDAPIECNIAREANNSNNGSAKISSYYNPMTRSYFDGYTGEEYKVDFIAPRSGEYTVRLNSPNVEGSNLDLFIMSTCNPFECIGQGVNEITDEEILLTLEEGDTIYLAVDAGEGLFDDFVLSIECCEAETSELIFDINEGDTSIVICRELGIPDSLEFSNTTSGTAPYTYFLTTINDTIISEIQPTIDVFSLETGKYRVYGLSYFRNLLFSPGQHITEARGDTCEILSSNYAVICIYDQPTADAGDDQKICEGDTVLLNGLITNIDESLWSTTGDGTFGNPNLDTTFYIPGPNDIMNDSVYLILTTDQNTNCPVAIDSLLLEIERTPRVLAGDDQYICQGDTVRLLGSIEYSPSSTWTTLGDGAFGNINNDTTFYIPGDLDITATMVQLVLTTAAGEICPSAMDTITVFIEPRPMADAGDDQTICEGETAILMATISNTNEFVWSSSGDGSFSDPGLGETDYTPGVVDIRIGSVTLFISTAGGELCPSASDSLILSIEPRPTANAGSDQFLCEGTPIQLTGAVTNTSGSLWSSSGDGVFDDANLLNTNYVPGSSDINLGTVTLTLTTNEGSFCPAAMDEMVVFIEPRPTADAGIDQTICEGETAIFMATISNTNEFVWSSSGDGSFSNPGLVETDYIPGVVDIRIGSVTLFISTAGGELCPSASDSLILSIEPRPTANAGSDQFLCEGTPIQLTGAVTNTSGSLWTSSGDGVFDNASLLNTNYVAGISDINLGTVTLTLTTNEGNFCPVASDELVVFIERQPIVDAGPDQLICENMTVQLMGSESNAFSINWTSSGDGMFDDSDMLDAIYTPGTGDINNGTVTLTLTTNSGEVCPSGTDELVVNIEYQPSVFAGEVDPVCEGATVNLFGDLANADTGLWSTSGDGTFADPTMINTTYLPGNSDVAQGSVQLTLSVAAGDQCPGATDMIDLNIVPNPVVIANVTDTSICLGTTITLSSMGSNCIWYDADDNIIDDACSIEVSPLSSTNYRLEEINTAMMVSCSDEVSISVDVIVPPDISLRNDTMICPGESIALVMGNSNCDDCECSWSPADGLDNPNSCNPTATPAVAGQLYTLTTTINGACPEEQSVEIAIVEPLDFSVRNDHIPIRQNSDAEIDILENDTFSISNLDRSRLDIDIFNTNNLPGDVDVQDLGQGFLRITAGGESLGLLTPPFSYVLTDMECGHQDEGQIEIQVFLNDQVSVCNPDLEAIGCEIVPDLALDFPSNDIVIWDRAGNIVHVAQPYDNDWKGLDIQSNRRVPSGPYYFALNLGQSPSGGQSQTIRGIISIFWK